MSSKVFSVYFSNVHHMIYLYFGHFDIGIKYVSGKVPRRLTHGCGCGVRAVAAAGIEEGSLSHR